MAATWIMNVTLNKELSAYIDCCDKVGAYTVHVKSENPEGTKAVFHIASCNGQQRVKRTVSVAGSEGEQLNIVWPVDEYPILCYESDYHAPDEDTHYNLKVI